MRNAKCEMRNLHVKFEAYISHFEFRIWHLSL